VTLTIKITLICFCFCHHGTVFIKLYSFKIKISHKIKILKHKYILDYSI